MKIEQYKPVDHSGTVIILLIDALLIVMLAVFCYYTFTALGQTTLTQGIADFYAWIGGAR